MVAPDWPESFAHEELLGKSAPLWLLKRQRRLVATRRPNKETRNRRREPVIQAPAVLPSGLSSSVFSSKERLSCGASASRRAARTHTLHGARCSSSHSKSSSL